MASLRPGPSRLAHPRGRNVLVAVVFLLTLAGCGDDTRATGGDTVGDDPSAPSSSATTETTEATATETTDPAPSSAPDDSGLEARLLTPDEMAGANEETVWEASASGPENGRTTGSCQRFDLVSLGASEAVVRAFTSNQDTVEAVQVVAEFADAKSAWRAHQVLKKWRSTCADRIDAADVSVGDLRTLPVSVGHGDSYVVRYGDAGAEEQHWAGVGISRRGPLLSLVQIDLVGQDYNYRAGEEPASLTAMSALADLS